MMAAFRWRADDGPLIVVLGSLKKERKTNVFKDRPHLTKLSRSAHAYADLKKEDSIRDGLNVWEIKRNDWLLADTWLFIFVYHR